MMKTVAKRLLFVAVVFSLGVVCRASDLNNNFEKLHELEEAEESYEGLSNTAIPSSASSSKPHQLLHSNTTSSIFSSSHAGFLNNNNTARTKLSATPSFLSHSHPSLPSSASSSKKAKKTEKKKVRVEEPVCQLDVVCLPASDCSLFFDLQAPVLNDNDRFQVQVCSMEKKTRDCKYIVASSAKSPSVYVNLSGFMKTGIMVSLTPVVVEENGTELRGQEQVLYWSTKKQAFREVKSKRIVLKPSPCTVKEEKDSFIVDCNSDLIPDGYHLVVHLSLDSENPNTKNRVQGFVRQYEALSAIPNSVIIEKADVHNHKRPDFFNHVDVIFNIGMVDVHHGDDLLLMQTIKVTPAGKASLAKKALKEKAKQAKIEAKESRFERESDESDDDKDYDNEKTTLVVPGHHAGKENQRTRSSSEKSRSSAEHALRPSLDLNRSPKKKN